MGHAFPEMLARSAARQVYRLLRLSAPLLRPLYQHVELEHRARAVTALVRIGWNGAAAIPPLIKESEPEPHGKEALHEESVSAPRDRL